MQKETTSFDLAYEEYVRSDSTIKNKRIRPEGVNVFDWLMEDKEIIMETDEEMKAAGLVW